MLLDCSLGHDLDGERLSTVLVHAQSDQAEGALAEGLAEHVSSFDILKLFERFVGFHSYCVLAGEVWGASLRCLRFGFHVFLSFDAFDRGYLSLRLVLPRVLVQLGRM